MFIILCTNLIFAMGLTDVLCSVVLFALVVTSSSPFFLWGNNFILVALWVQLMFLLGLEERIVVVYFLL